MFGYIRILFTASKNYWLLPPVVIALLLSASLVRADSDSFNDDAYILPLSGGYAIHKDGFRSSNTDGKFQLVEASISGGNISLGLVVPDIQQIGVNQQAIFGKAKKGYFILVSSKPPKSIEYFDSIQKWHSALTLAGAAPDAKLNDPDALAANAPERLLQPWKYEVMHGFLGMSDDVWSVLVQAIGLLTAFTLGAVTKRTSLTTAIVLGIAVDIVAIIVLGDGLAALPGLVLFPIIFYFAAHSGKFARRRLISPCPAPV